MTDDIVVDMEFGTGAVKITPAHDTNDYEVGVRHKLEFINILNDDGTFNENAGEKFKGMKRFHARVAVVQALKDLGLYVETKDNPMQIPVCRSALVSFSTCFCLTRIQQVGRHHRAHLEAPVVGELPAACGRSTEGKTMWILVTEYKLRPLLAYPRRRAAHHAEAVRDRVVPLVGEPSGLVHFTSAVVGSPVSGLLRQHRGR